MKTFYRPSECDFLDSIKIGRKIRFKAQLDAENIVSKASKAINILEAQSLANAQTKSKLHNLIALERLRKKQLSRNRTSILNIAISIAKECMQQELIFNPDCLLPRIEQAIEAVCDCDSIRIHTSKESSSIIQNKLKNNIQADVVIEYVHDESFGLFDFKLETRLGVVEGKIDEQLNAMQHALMANVDLVFAGEDHGD